LQNNPSKSAYQQPLALTEMPTKGIVGVLTDVDDTLTYEGCLNATTYSALWDLKAAGFKIIPVTGRSTGWAHLMLTQWPVDAVVAESGGTYLTKDANGAIKVHFYEPDTQYKRAALLEHCIQILPRFSPLTLAVDNDYRCADIAIDFNEQIKLLPEQKNIVNELITELEALGYSARASSIHINVWQGDFDKAPGTMRLLNEHFAGSANPSHWVFIGDAPNDQTMFVQFANSVGVANISPHLKWGILDFPPKYITQLSHGAGFAELVRHLIGQ
jgi:HAD superfamily hydrolase (TIGR01484 family)